MTDAQLEKVLAGMTADPYGWRTELTTGAPTFMGMRVRVNVATRTFPFGPPIPPPVNEEERVLLASILRQLPAVLAEAERRFRESGYVVHRPDVLAHIASPEIWLDRECREDDGPARWTLVLGRDDAPDFGYHIEFDGLSCVRIWAGD